MSKTSRRKFSSEFNSKVCIEAIKKQQTIESLAKKYDLHPTQINTAIANACPFHDTLPRQSDFHSLIFCFYI